MKILKNPFLSYTVGQKAIFVANTDPTTQLQVMVVKQLNDPVLLTDTAVFSFVEKIPGNDPLSQKLVQVS